MIVSILLVFAFVLALLAARNINPPNWSLGWIAFALYILSILLGNFDLVKH